MILLCIERARKQRLHFNFSENEKFLQNLDYSVHFSLNSDIQNSVKTLYGSQCYCMLCFHILMTAIFLKKPPRRCVLVKKFIVDKIWSFSVFPFFAVYRCTYRQTQDLYCLQSQENCRTIFWENQCSEISSFICQAGKPSKCSLKIINYIEFTILWLTWSIPPNFYYCFEEKKTKFQKLPELLLDLLCYSLRTETWHLSCDRIMAHIFT